MLAENLCREKIARSSKPNSCAEGNLQNDRMEKLAVKTESNCPQSIMCKTLNGQGQLARATELHPGRCKAIRRADFSLEGGEVVS